MSHGTNLGFEAHKEKTDNVHHPSHYEKYSLETIEAIRGQSTP